MTTILPSGVTYGRVTARIITAVADGIDADDKPDSLPAVGTVTFTPNVPRVLLMQGIPTTIIPQPITVQLDANGSLDVMLVATDSPALNPAGFAYTVSYRLQGATLPNHNLAVPTGATVDLTTASPVPGAAPAGIVRGEKGEKGDPGLAGPPGVDGVDGRDGRDGVDGKDGAPGGQGIQGIQGAKGDPGAKGDQGIQGIQGIQGVKGDPGAKGDQGLQGIQGVKGDPGAKGDQGIQGLKGDPGIQGIPGADGAKGDKGATGPAGPNNVIVSATAPANPVAGVTVWIDTSS